MADDITFQTTVATPPSGAVVATDDVGGKHYQKIKVALGAENAVDTMLDSGQQTMTNSVPVVVASDQSAVPVSASSLPLPAGASTSANQSTIIGHLDGVEGLLTTIDADTSTLAGAVSGSEMQVDLVAALPAGNNNIGDVDIASLPNEGQQTMANSISVAVASDQSAIPVSATSLPLPTGAATSAKQDTQITELQDIETDLEAINAKLAAAKTADYDTGAGTDTVQMVGVALPASGGAVAGGTASNPLRTDPTGTTTQPVSATSLPLPTGAATLAEQQTQSASLSVLDDWDESDRAKVNLIAGQAGITAGAGTVGASTPRVTLASDDPAVSNTAAIKTAVELIDNAISGAEMQVDVVASLPAGTNNIGDVDVLSVVPGTGATNLGKAEDAAHTSGDVGVMALGVRNDAGSAFGADGDYVPLSVDSSGAVRVTGTQYAVDAALGSTPTGTLGLMKRDDALTTLTPVEGDAIEQRCDSLGNHWVTLGTRLDQTNDAVSIYSNTAKDGSGTKYQPLVDSDGHLQVDVLTVPSHAVTNAGTFAVQESGAALTSLQLIDDAVFAEDVAANAGDKGLAILAVRRDADTSLVGADNDYANLQVNANGALKVEVFDGGDSHTVDDGGGSLTVDGTVTANAGTGTFTTTSVGTVADDATTPGAPVMIGGQAKETDGTDPGSVSAEDDVVRAIFDRNRRQLVNTAHPNLWKVNENHSSAQTNNQLKAAPGANLSLYITDVIVSNGATAGTLKLVEDEGGTPADICGPYYMAINGGAVMNFKTPIRLTANKSLGFTSTSVTTHTIQVHGYTAP